MQPDIDPNQEISIFKYAPMPPWPHPFLSLSHSLTVCRVLAEPTQLTIFQTQQWRHSCGLRLLRVGHCWTAWYITEFLYQD